MMMAWVGYNKNICTLRLSQHSDVASYVIVAGISSLITMLGFTLDSCINQPGYNYYNYITYKSLNMANIL